MKKIMVAISVMIMAALLTCVSFSQVKAQIPNIVWPTLPEGILELRVDESHIFYVEITSSEPFVLAMAMTDAYYPGRSIVYWHGGDRATQTSEASLELTITGKSLTADLPVVCNWPEDFGDCWEEGVAPVSIRVGVRYKGGLVYSEGLAFAVRVVP